MEREELLRWLEEEIRRAESMERSLTDDEGGIDYYGGRIDALRDVVDRLDIGA